MVLCLLYRVTFSVFELFHTYGRTDGRTDGNGECNVRCAGMGKCLEENEGGVDAEEHRQGTQAQIKGHVCGGSLKVRVLWILEWGGNQCVA
jgi:hypothetical protein